MSEPVHTTETPTTAEPDPAAAPPQPTDWEAEAKKWERRSKDNFAKLKEAEPKLAEYETLRAAQQTAEERRTEELTRWQTEAEKWRGVGISSRIQALAADFADPTDAIDALSADPSKYLGVDGQINDDAIRTDLADVLTRKPHWRRNTETPGPRLPAPNAAQGTGGAPSTDPATQFASLIQGQLRS